MKTLYVLIALFSFDDASAEFRNKIIMQHK